MQLPDGGISGRLNGDALSARRADSMNYQLGALEAFFESINFDSGSHRLLFAAFSRFVVRLNEWQK
jgi:hypothetical protein